MHKKQERLSNFSELTGLFTERVILHKGNPLLHSIALFFFLVSITTIVFAVQMEIESVPSWSVFVPLIVLSISIGYMSFSNCGNQFLFPSAERVKDLLALVAFLVSILYSFFLLLCLLQVAQVIHWKWYIIHVPVWIQHILAIAVPMNMVTTKPQERRKVKLLVLLQWGIAGAPWLLLHILLVVRLDVTFQSENLELCFPV